jgi:glycosyltransferase involved in cell wall biosynthesis
VDGENGFLADESAESFAEKIIEIMDMDGAYKTVGDRAGKTLYRSWDMVAEEVAEKYRKIIDEYKKEQELLETLKALKKKGKNK